MVETSKFGKFFFGGRSPRRRARECIADNGVIRRPTTAGSIKRDKAAYGTSAPNRVDVN